MSSGDAPTSITATCPQCHQTVQFTPDPNRLGPSGRDQSNLWVCSNPSCGYVAEHTELESQS